MFWPEARPKKKNLQVLIRKKPGQNVERLNPMAGADSRTSSKTYVKLTLPQVYAELPDTHLKSFRLFIYMTSGFKIYMQFPKLR